MAIQLADIEREYSPVTGELGRGVLVSKAEYDAIDPTGYRDFDGGRLFDIRSADGGVVARKWRGWLREDGDRHLVAAVEFFSGT